jgi:carboxypeptidase C (cathepsin A)
LLENGPFVINGSATPVLNPYGWNAVSNLLYVDQPAGTGFSFVTNPLGYVTNERQIATELWDFIRQFYGLYPKYSTLDLYVFGESYAGHYVPATGQVIVESNSIYAKNLKGLGIGNGWVDPYLQYAAYGEVHTYRDAFISVACL